MIKNAIIKSAQLTKADHNLLSGWLFLEYGDGGGQGFGGSALYLPESFKNHTGQLNFAGLWIFRVLEIAGVDDWKDLPNKAIRVDTPYTLGSTISGIGHIIDNKWFHPEKEFQLLKSKATN